ncbi:hypothetical protein Taro_052669 [Colocasia esculenta]|uniref:Uncharacterized protein n=1 Tax=Colocasia esculenta TaxID=4460 RepID=A0A843XJA3_COLES|nr:hypothetical protein [Colocasia esculenta]
MVAMGVGVAFLSWRPKVRAALTRPGQPSHSGFSVFEGTCSWCLERGGGCHSDVKAPTGRLYLWRRTTLEPPSAEDTTCREVACRRDIITTLSSVAAWSQRLGLPQQRRDRVGCRDKVAMARYITTTAETCYVLAKSVFCGVFAVFSSYCTRGTCETSQQQQGACRAEEIGR